MGTEALPVADRPTEILKDAIEESRPLVLYAGQYLDSSSGLVLDSFLGHIGIADRDDGWRAALQRDISDENMAWISERFDRSVPSEGASAIFSVPWSAIFTSSIDPQFARNFETRGREPEQILSPEFHARVPRSRSRPPIYYLFGKPDEPRETSEYARPPTNQAELKVRLATQVPNLLNRVAETVTARGVVVIAGYKPSTDWMSVDTLLAPLYNLRGAKVLWFGCRDRVNSDLLQPLENKNILTATSASLADAICNPSVRNALDDPAVIMPDEPGVVSVGKQQVLDITPALRLRVEASSTIVDDGWTQEPEVLSSEEIYGAFRRFHGARGNFRLLVEGVARGFAIKREFESSLQEAVNANIRNIGQADSNDVVILHGQSGAGKSIALARLVRRLRDRRLPVLIASSRVPHHMEIRDFCTSAERSGAPMTVLICDINQASRLYDDLSSALRSVGRKLLIIGTSYRLEGGVQTRTRRFVEAPAKITDWEMSVLQQILRKNGIEDSSFPHAPDISIFAMLYRQLPAARESLASGVASEARASESALRERARSVPRRRTDLSSMAQQLIDLGIAKADSSIFEDDVRLAALGTDAAGRLVDQVMAAGRLNCPVPVNVIFRGLSSGSEIDVDGILHLFRDLDLFRWRTTSDGSNFFVSPRIQLEAELICRRRLTIDQEIDRLIELVKAVRFGIDRDSERSFLLDLLSRAGRSGPRKEAYRSGYIAFADAIRGLREKNRSTDTALVLRECAFRRQAVFIDDPDYPLAQDEENKVANLDKAREIIEDALREIASGQLSVHRRTEQSLLAERSAIYGYLAVQHARSDSGDSFWSDYLAARSANRQAIGFNDYHVIDIALWTGRDVLESKRERISECQRAEILTDLYATIDIADDIFKVVHKRISIGRNMDDSGAVSAYGYGDADEGAVAINQRARYLERRSNVSRSMGDMQLDQKSLLELQRVAPAAAVYLIARRRAERVYLSDPPFDDDTRKVAGDVADYISSNPVSEVESDPRCQRLLLKLRWAQATGNRLMFNPRGRTPVRSDQVSELLRIVGSLNEQAGAGAHNRDRFLEATLCWLSKDAHQAMEIWRSLSKETTYEDRSRVVRWLVETDKEGDPRKYRGRVERKGEDDWCVRIKGIAYPIAVLARDFPQELTRGLELRPFNIAFNYIGPIADPPSRRGRG